MKVKTPEVYGDVYRRHVRSDKTVILEILDPNTEVTCLQRNVITKRDRGGRHGMKFLHKLMYLFGIELRACALPLDMVGATNNVELENRVAEMEYGGNTLQHKLMSYHAKIERPQPTPHLSRDGSIYRIKSPDGEKGLSR